MCVFLIEYSGPSSQEREILPLQNNEALSLSSQIAHHRYTPSGIFSPTPNNRPRIIYMNYGHYLTF